ncbi:MAG: tRNA (adenosine(37)-N6)-threonylcarbamoyltransferase complex ATPase subunit type 1 TsaE [Pseudomonadota bacterium]
MLTFAARVADNISADMVIFLEGDLGAGKTTFARGFLRQLGHKGAVKSPTFTLVESYDLCLDKQPSLKQTIYHFDLYRLSDPEELDYMGISDYLDGQAILLIEWPKKGEGFLPIADLVINIEYHGKQRLLSLVSNTDKGESFIQKL